MWHKREIYSKVMLTEEKQCKKETNFKTYLDGKNIALIFAAL